MMRRVWMSAVFIFLAAIGPLAAQTAPRAGSIRGVIADPLGGRISGAAVTLLREGTPAGDTTTAADGTYTFDNVTPGRYQVSARASGFEPNTSASQFAGA